LYDAEAFRLFVVSGGGWVLLGDTKGTYTNAALIPLAVEYCSGDILF